MSILAKKLTKSAIFCLCLLGTLVANAQGLPAGQWRYHSFFGRDSLLALSPSTVYTSYGTGIMTYDRLNQSLSTLDKTDGLTDVNVTALAHAYNRELLVIGYRDGGLDLKEGNRITHIDGLKRADLTVSKRILAINIIGNNAYASGEFGFLVIDLTRREIRFSNTALDATGSNQSVTVSSICQNGSTLYLATSRGILNIQANQNVQDSRLFTVESFGARGLPTNGGSVRSIVAANGFAYVSFSRAGVFVKPSFGADWVQLEGSGITSSPFRSLTSLNNRVLLSAGGEVYSISGLAYTQVADSTGPVGAGAPKVAFTDTEGEIWVADLGSGLLKLRGSTAEAFQTSSPGFNTIFRLYGYKDKMVALAGGFSSALMGQLNNQIGVGIFENNFWGGLNIGKELPKGVRDISSASYDPKTKALYFAAYGNGIIVRPDDKSQKATLINDTTRARDGNRFCSAADIPGLFVRVPSITFDRNGNLWAANFCDSVLHLRDLDNRWFAYNGPSPANRANASQILVDDQFVKYLRISDGRASQDNSVMVRSADNRTWGIISKNETRGGLPDPSVYDMVIDPDGALWLATGQGLAVLYNPTAALSPQPFAVTLPIFDGRPLLENDVCTTIMLDGGGRKWVGTRTSGIWVFDKDVTQVLANFTTANSPLPSNDITDMDIVPATGEVFIATEGGLVSYNSVASYIDAAEGEGSSCLRIYPSPVRPNYSGNVAIDCLPENAVVKITDAGGRLVFEGVAAGGGIIWNGRDYNGRRPRPGVYLVYAYSDAQNAKVVGRFAIVE